MTRNSVDGPAATARRGALARARALTVLVGLTLAGSTWGLAVGLGPQSATDAGSGTTSTSTSDVGDSGTSERSTGSGLGTGDTSRPSHGTSSAS